MPSHRDTAEDFTSNPYSNATLVGNWAEDRQRRRIVYPSRSARCVEGEEAVGMTWCADGIFDDPAVTLARDPEAARADLQRSTYTVDYSGTSGTSAKDGDGGGDTAFAGPVSTVMRGPLHASGTAGEGGDTLPRSSASKTGVDRVLLFCVDPVADPEAPMPISTNAEAYGAFYYAEGGEEGHCAAAALSNSTVANTTKNKAADRHLYDSVTRTAAVALLATQSPHPSGVPTTGRTVVASQERQRRLTQSRRAAATAHSGETGWTFSSLAAASARAASIVEATATNASATSSVEPGPQQGAGHPGASAREDERWCTMKQMADIPVDCFSLQRRLPPVHI